MSDEEFWSKDRPPFASPGEWWDDVVERSEEPEAVRAAFQELTTAGCLEVELIERLLALYEISHTMNWSKRNVESYAKAAAELHDRMLAFETIRAAAHLRKEIPSGVFGSHVHDVLRLLRHWPKTDSPLTARNELINYVDRYARGQFHAELALLITEVSEPITIGALKVATTRLRKTHDPKGHRKRQAKRRPT
jgi:hypothetical protein